MKTPSSIKIERWEGEDYIITGLHHHGGVFSKHEAELILRFVQDAIPIIQADAFKSGMTEAVGIVANSNFCGMAATKQQLVTSILHARDLL